MNRRSLLHLGLGTLVAGGAGLRAAEGAPASQAEIVSLRKIWDRDPHNAFTDLVRHRGRWYCVFRCGAAHVSGDGFLRVLTSEDGEKWVPAATLFWPDADLRDAKITVTPNGRLMLSGAAALHPPSPVRHQSLVWFSDDGLHWDGGHPVADPNVWLWRVTWHAGTAYGVGYSTAGRSFVRLYSSRDGVDFKPLVETLFDRGQPNEHSLLFQPDGTCRCLLRRDELPATAQLGSARPPYTDWTWKDLRIRFGGPQTLRLADGRIIAGGRLYDGKVRTGLCRLDPERGALTEFLTLPSGGDTSYPGLVWHDGLLWMSYYSSHEGKTSIYLARVRLG